MNFFATITSLENKDGEKIFKVILNDTLIFFVKLLVFLLIIYIGKKITQIILKYIEKISKDKIDPGAKQFSKSFIKLGLYIIFFLFGLLVFGFKEQSIITMISAVGLGIGISLKGFLSNFAGGVVILFTRPFTVGEYIEVNGAFGEVYKIDVFSTHINTLDSKRVIIPNNVMINSNVINHDANEYRRIKLTVPVAYECDQNRAVEVLKRISKTFDGLESERKSFINIMSYGDSSVNIYFIVWTKREYYYSVRSKLMAYIIKIFNEENIEIPYNKLEVNLKN
ncbi:mechanosensitive ion channel family protein [Fusobacterium sp.]|uniref:mechanosensitive ion channel family protein n=1 Tax=Fusobacterium sp. TaxID=68766 RepID=UPI00290154E5|nr:mechanosensitive ion channel family protein [Fusobacterium sp.]MDU1910207.1 mechanosensitive ion channel family protein [Fusobacterium sp.]